MTYDEKLAFLLEAFRYEHLPPHLAEVSKPFCELAHSLAEGASNPWSTMSLKHLIIAKDAAVRSALV